MKDKQHRQAKCQAPVKGYPEEIFSHQSRVEYGGYQPHHHSVRNVLSLAEASGDAMSVPFYREVRRNEARLCHFIRSQPRTQYFIVFT